MWCARRIVFVVMIVMVVMVIVVIGVFIFVIDNGGFLAL